MHGAMQGEHITRIPFARTLGTKLVQGPYEGCFVRQGRFGVGDRTRLVGGRWRLWGAGGSGEQSFVLQSVREESGRKLGQGFR